MRMGIDTASAGSKEGKIEIYTLGNFMVCKGGQPLSAKSRRLNKSWEFFLYLITYSGKNVPLEAIQEAIWPEGEHPDPMRSMKNIAHRLRKIIDSGEDQNGDSSIIYSNGCYRWNSAIAYWWDAENFETLCIEAHSLVKKNTQLAALKYQEALCLYRGDYLPEFTSSDWVIPVRNYYRQLFLRSVIELLEICKQARRHSEITKICEKTFLIEQFEEELHLSYMEALLEMGKTAQARAHYQYITSLLYREFGTKPSSAMQRLYRSMKSDRSRPELTFSDIRDMMSERDNIDGAMLCDADSFELICSLEKRRAKRQSTPLFIATLTLTGPDFQLPPTEELFAAMENLKQVFLSNLRKGDVFHQWNESQCVALLSAMNVEQAEGVLKRISKKLKNDFAKDLIVPRSTVYPLVSPENA